jgi:hypothetical protein
MKTIILLLVLFTSSFSFQEDCKIRTPEKITICKSASDDTIVFNYSADCKIYYSELKIFNRWGQELFKETNKKGKGWKGWNGKTGNKYAPHAETLVYQINYKVTKKSKLKTLKGYIVVVHKC